MTDYKHVIYDIKTGEWACLNCNERIKAPERIQIGTGIELMKGFLKAHQSCNPPLKIREKEYEPR